MSESALYRQVDDRTIVRYDPTAAPGSPAEYTLIGPDELPAELVLSARCVRLSHAEEQADPTARFRRMILLAMLEFQQKAHDAGEAEASDPYLQTLAKLANDPDAQRKLRLGWISQPTSRGSYGVKAVGTAEHAGRVLYGKDAQRALANQGKKGGAPVKTPEVTRRSRDRAVELLSKAPHRAGGLSGNEIKELATHMSAMTVHQLRKARVMLDASWGGQRLRKDGMIEKLMNHVRGHVDRQMQAAGMHPEEPPAKAPRGGKNAAPTSSVPPAPAPAPTPTAQPTPTQPARPAPTLSAPKPAPVPVRPPVPVVPRRLTPDSVRPPRPAPPPPLAPPPAPAAPTAEPDYSKWDSILHTSRDRAQAEQFARITGTAIRPEKSAAPPFDKSKLPDRLKAARADPSQWDALAADLARPSVNREDLIALAGHISPDVQAKAKRLPPSKQIALLKENLKAT